MYINQLPVSVDPTQNVLYIIQRRLEQLDVLFRLLYINQLPVSVDRTQNVFYIIQRRSATPVVAT
jgi:hypothetical protein